MAVRTTVYIETTIVSYLTARPTRDIILAAQQQITQDWWGNHRTSFDLYTSQFTIIEASAGDVDAVQRRLEKLKDIPQLHITDEAFDLTDALLTEAAIPAVAQRDAEHVAVTAVNGIDVLLTWNCKHLANVLLRDKIEEVCESNGYKPPKICTPEELIGDQP